MCVERFNLASGALPYTWTPRVGTSDDPAQGEER